ncbi:suppressor of fused domain protein [Chitinimonas viridis]|uniref:Suppressor of fused domain protein n=1 Tax=Chitinimonas viridis TaxID=664880 RepID=A0ABT8B4F6_9NEIS|nr:suppressor of fused domain protein [Chitinimonas viridis]MDN3576433.1 suppressor of fused domain protein [Chitinimonas viridis]
MKEKIDKYFDHVESIAGREGAFFRMENDPKIIVSSYVDVPEAGCLTAFSFGLSLADCKEWRYSKPELVISMDSTDIAWALAMGELVRCGWGRCLFSYGEVLDFGRQISEESDMSAFLVFASSSLEVSDLRVDLDDWIVNISQIYPVHKQEVSLIREIGAERFFYDFNIDFFDPRRKPVLVV